jgi:hypothetical protein
MFRFTAVKTLMSKILFTPADANDALLRINCVMAIGSIATFFSPSV